MIKKLILGLLLLSFSLAAAQLFAMETKASEDTVYSLGEVIVTAPGDTGVESVAVLHQITAADIERRRIKTLDRALELLPGLDVRKGAQGIPRINFRGLRSRHVVILLNGIPFNSTYDGQFDPSTIPVENIAKIKVSFGNHSVLYGQGGLGGVINIITKKGSKGLHGSASADIDENGDYNGQITVSGGNESLDFFVSSSRLYSDGFQISDDFTPTTLENGNIRENSDSERTNLFANLGIQAGDTLSFGISAGANSGEYGKPPSTIDDKKDPFRKSPKYERTEDYDGQFGQVSMGYDPGGLFGLRGWAYVNSLEEYKARYDDDQYDSITQKGSYRTTDETVAKGVTLQGTFDFESSGKLALSIGGEKNEYDTAGAIIEKKNGPLKSYDRSHEIDMYTLAIEYDRMISNNFGLVAGYSHHWQKRETGTDDDAGSLLLGIFYDLNEKTTLRASYAGKIRFASIKNLYDISSGNGDLTTETSDNVEAGIIRKLPWDMTGELSVFMNDVEDYIEKNTTTEIYENNEKYRFKGIEAVLTKAIKDSGTIRLSYSYLDAEDRSPDSKVEELEYRPKHKITVEGNYAFDFGLSVYASLMHLMDQVHYANDFTKGKIKDFTIVDLKLEQHLLNEQWYIYAGVDNLFDENYEESYGFPQPGRTAYVGVKVKF